MPHTRKRMIALGAAALMAFSGLAVGTATSGAAVAAAAECSTTGSRTFQDTGITYTISQEVVGPSEVAPGGTVKYLTKVSSNSAVGGLIRQITDHHPAGFSLVKAELDYSNAVGQRNTSDETAGAEKNATANTVKVSGAGWTTATPLGGGYVGLITTYKVPDSAVPGEKLESGADISLQRLLDQRHEAFNPSGVCVTIREKNAIENVTGSLDSAGLGSATGSADGSSQMSAASSDPQSFIADIINNINIGELIGLS